jgi:phage repressor protein C with HTH and peptisase S24 domain
MLKHDDVWRGIDRLADAFGYSPSGLAKKAGLDPTSFNKSKRYSPEGKARWPTTESISKILAVTNASLTDFIDLMGATESETAPGRLRKIPVIGFAQAGRDGFFDADGYPAGDGWDEVSFPEQSRKSDDIYALKVSGASMEPLYRPGDLIVVSPAATVRRGDRVVVKTRKGEIMAKELIKQGPSKTELRSLNAAFDTVTLSPRDIIWIARILWVSQ